MHHNYCIIKKFIYQIGNLEKGTDRNRQEKKKLWRRKKKKQFLRPLRIAVKNQRFGCALIRDVVKNETWLYSIIFYYILLQFHFTLQNMFQVFPKNGEKSRIHTMYLLTWCMCNHSLIVNIAFSKVKSN